MNRVFYSILSAISLLAVLPMSAAAAPVESSTKEVKSSFSFKEDPYHTTEVDDWTFVIEPYLWATAMSGKVGIKGERAVEVSHSAKSILQHLDWGIFAKAEVRKGRWGLLGDGFFAQLSASGHSSEEIYKNVDVTAQQGMASLALAYRLIEDRRGFVDVYAGARYNYMGFDVGANPDTSRIRDVSDTAVQRISAGIRQRADAFLAKNAGALQATVRNEVEKVVTAKFLEKTADLSRDTFDSLDRRYLVRLTNKIRNGTGEYRELLSAVAAERSAAEKNQLTAAVRARVTKAEKKLSRAIAREIEDALPTSAEGSQWWVDPIVGLRGQINFTRWLYLAAQGDVGGFGAGSDIAWNVQANLGVNFTRHIFGELGYRYFYMDYAGGGLIYDAAEYGIFSSLGVRF